jgi:hypothetical protein
VRALQRAEHTAARVTRYSLDDALQAYDDMQRGALDGRTVVVPTGP